MRSIPRSAQVRILNKADPKALSLHASAVYRICLQGWLAESWEDEMGMRITNSADAADSPVAILIGELPDQAALFGVLNRLYGLGYPLVSVDCLYPSVVSRRAREDLDEF